MIHDRYYKVFSILIEVYVDSGSLSQSIEVRCNNYDFEDHQHMLSNLHQVRSR